MSHRVCPWWLGYILASPVRRLLYAPEEIIKPHITEGMNVLDIGCGMGFFSIPAARLVGDSGKVVCVDLQEKMIKGLIRRSEKAGVLHRIDARTCSSASLELNDIAGKIDFVLAFALIHEVPDKERLLSEIGDIMKPMGKMLIAEPMGHVSKLDFHETVSIAQKGGFEVISNIVIRRNHVVLLGKKK